MNFLCRPPRTEYESIPLKQLFHVKSATPEILLPSIIYFSKLHGIYCGAEGNSSLWNFNFTRSYVSCLEKLIFFLFFFFHSYKNKRSINFFWKLKEKREVIELNVRIFSGWNSKVFVQIDLFFFFFSKYEKYLMWNVVS